MKFGGSTSSLRLSLVFSLENPSGEGGLFPFLSGALVAPLSLPAETGPAFAFSSAAYNKGGQR